MATEQQPHLVIKETLDGASIIATLGADTIEVPLTYEQVGKLAKLCVSILLGSQFTGLWAIT